MHATPFIDALPTGDRDWLLAAGQARRIHAQGMLIREGEAAEAIHLVTGGLFAVTHTDATGRRETIDRCAPGAILGELSWLDGEPASASVTATRASEVLALPIRTLEAKIAADPAFAARFLRAVATVAAGRTRADRTRARQRGAIPSNPAPDRDPQAGLLARVAELKDALVAADRVALANGGQVPREREAEVRTRYGLLAEECNALIGDGSPLPDAGREALGAVARRELLPLIGLAATAERFYSKPRGYAGDCQTLELIYRNEPRGVGRMGPLLDACFLDRPAPRAIVNRRRLLAREIRGTRTACAMDPVRVASLGCGPGREIFDAFDGLDDPARLAVTAVDSDEDALAMVRARGAERGIAARVLGIRADVFQVVTGREELDLPPQDLIYSVDLIDYFNDNLVVTLMDWIHDHLRPGGRAILGNFHPRNPDKAVMDHVFGWRLVHRDESRMHELYARSKFGRGCTRILFEEEQVNLFAECRRESDREPSPRPS
jgi:CRP-like cAMP-binding protein/SAM-dependent methyltransferase